MPNIIHGKQRNQKYQIPIGEKKQIQEFLEEKKVKFFEKETIPMLLEKVKNLNIPKEYCLGSITKKICVENGKDIQVLRLPVGNSSGRK